MKKLSLFRATFGGVGTAAGDVFPTVGYVFGAMGVLFGVAIGGPAAIALAAFGFATFFAITAIQGYLIYKSDRLRENNLEKLNTSLVEKLNFLKNHCVDAQEFVNKINTLLNINLTKEVNYFFVTQLENLFSSNEDLLPNDSIISNLFHTKTNTLAEKHPLTAGEKIKPAIMGFFGAFSVIAGGSAGTLGSLTIAVGGLTAVLASPIGLGIVIGILSAASLGGLAMAYANYRYAKKAHELRSETKVIDRILKNIARHDDWVAGYTNAKEIDFGQNHSGASFISINDKAYFNTLRKRRHDKLLKIAPAEIPTNSSSPSV